MAVVAKYQLYPSASYNWLATTGACKDMIDEFKTWIGLVNANASQSGQTCVVLKDETSSTNANFYGMTVQMKDPDGGDLYFRLHTSTANALQFEAGDTYSDAGQNGGYGDITGYSYSDTNISFRTSAKDFKSFIAYNTVDGEEWFVFGWGADAVSYEDMLVVGKTTEGLWVAGATDGNANLTAVASVTGGYIKAQSFGLGVNTSAIPVPGLFFHNSSNVAGSGSDVDVVALKSLDLWRGRYETFGDWATIDAANNDYLLYVTGQAGVWVRTN